MALISDFNEMILALCIKLCLPSSNELELNNFKVFFKVWKKDWEMQMFSLQGLFEPGITLLTLLPRPAPNLYLCLPLTPDSMGGRINRPPACYSRILSHKMLSYGAILTSPGFLSLYPSFEIFLLFSLCWYMIFAVVIVIYPSWFGL